MTQKTEKDTVEKTLEDLGITNNKIKTEKIESNNGVPVKHLEWCTSEACKSNIDRVTQTTSDYEYYLYCKHQLELLIASGKCKEFTGKLITFQELDNMRHEQVIKHFKVYEESRLARINDSISDSIVKCYSKVCKHIIPIEDENKLYNELKNDYLVMTELQKWVGYLSFQLGGVMTLISTGVITWTNVKALDKPVEIKEKKEEIQKEVISPINK